MYIIDIKNNKQEDKTMIKTETRHYTDTLSQLWNLPNNSRDYKVFVNGDGREVDYDYISRKYGEATEKNAQKFFEDQAKEEEEDWELVDEGKKPFYTR